MHILQVSVISYSFSKTTSWIIRAEFYFSLFAHSLGFCLSFLHILQVLGHFPWFLLVLSSSRTLSATCGYRNRLPSPHCGTIFGDPGNFSLAAELFRLPKNGPTGDQLSTRKLSAHEKWPRGRDVFQVPPGAGSEAGGSGNGR